MRSLRERLNSSERASEGLNSDLSSMVAQRDNTQSELHQARLQAAQLTLQLADASLALREGRARWAQERQSLQLSAEVLYHWYPYPVSVAQERIMHGVQHCSPTTTTEGPWAPAKTQRWDPKGGGECAGGEDGESEAGGWDGEGKGLQPGEKAFM